MFGPLGGLLALLARVLGLLALLGLPVQALMWSVHLAASLLLSALKLATLLSSALSAMPRRCVSICTFVLVKQGFALLYFCTSEASKSRVDFDKSCRMCASLQSLLALLAGRYSVYFFTGTKVQILTHTCHAACEREAVGLVAARQHTLKLAAPKRERLRLVLGLLALLELVKLVLVKRERLRQVLDQ